MDKTDHDTARAPLPGLARLEDRLVGGRDDLRGALGERHARIGERDAARAAVEQRGADLLFEVAYLARQRRLRDTQPAGGPAKVQGLREHQKIAQMAQFHGRPPNGWN
ncbi:Argininosuccinate lyase [Bordetella pertussis]|nr:Argininosuccinate lyase [Bordetella pertussis]